MHAGQLVANDKADTALSDDVLAEVFKIKAKDGQITRVQKPEKT